MCDYTILKLHLILDWFIQIIMNVHKILDTTHATDKKDTKDTVIAACTVNTIDTAGIECIVLEKIVSIAYSVTRVIHCCFGFAIDYCCVNT